MPKKMRGENSKAVEARARKADAKAAAEAKKQKEIEDAYWKDDDKHANKKIQRKAGKEQKRQEELARKLENKKLFDEEDSNLKGPATKKSAPKVTRAEIAANRQRVEEENARAAAMADRQLSHTEVPLEENANLALAEEAGEGVVSARNIDEAISALSVKEANLEKHPEKRVKAAYAAYEEENLPRLKAENPNLRLSQLKQMLKKDWMKAPENPMNQRFQSYNTKR
ncbi:coiled-coil domain-containing protein 124-like [Diadema antillarum]|uniref:coiled-coil domain-containing protein 124-like n=1 Tax=Diadema antillarum TaxID=105358 RepID=UPI003A8C1136